MDLTTKDRHRAKLIEYCGNPENDFPNRSAMSTMVLGFKDIGSMYRHFSPDELCEIEREALDIRRTKYNPEIAKVDKALFKKAASGDTPAAKLIYQRFECWSEKQIREHTGKDGGDIIIKTSIPEPNGRNSD